MLPIVLSSILLAAPASQMPPIGVIDFYGVRTVTVADLRAALGVEEGDPAPEEASGLRHRLESMPGVVSADVSAVCCVDGRTVLWVGIEERGEPALAFDPAPAGTVRLPADVVQAGADFEAALMAAVQAGDADEDDSAGHALMHNPAARAIQERFIGFAARDLAVLRDVLQHGRRADERALAAQVLAYAADKAAVVPDLVRAMRDPDDEVRNNAMRALWVMAEVRGRHAGRGHSGARGAVRRSAELAQVDGPQQGVAGAVLAVGVAGSGRSRRAEDPRLRRPGRDGAMEGAGVRAGAVLPARPGGRTARGRDQGRLGPRRPRGRRRGRQAPSLVAHASP